MGTAANWIAEKAKPRSESSAVLQRKAWSLEPVEAVPPIVHEVLRSPGQPLDPGTRAFMEPRFGHDFSGVRVHTDAHAAQSARTVDALAYTIGQDVVFGTGQYAPRSSVGLRLIAHELTHTVQQTNSKLSPEVPLRLGAHDEYERQAETAASGVANNRSISNPSKIGVGGTPAGIVQRSLLGGILGGIGGALGGALVGGLLGGPIGAIVGGVAGLIGGALIGDAASTEKRSLTADEIKYAKEVFKDSIDYSEIKITRDSLLATGAPRTLGNTIHLRSDWGHFKGKTMELTQLGMETLIHEMGHVWQYQNGGLAYIPESLWAQLKVSISGKSRNAAYDWRAAHTAKLPWEKWNPEQQAEAIEDYNKLLRKSKDGKATVAELAELSILVTYMQNVWMRQGAPIFETPDLKSAPF